MLKKNQIINLKKDSYTLVEPIGEGGQGVIWRVSTSSSQQTLILKTVQIQKSNSLGRQYSAEIHEIKQLAQRMQEEIDFLISVKNHHHNFIAECLDYGVIHSAIADLPAMIMPHYPNNFSKYLSYDVNKKPNYNLQTALKWIIQLSQALNYTHSKSFKGQAYIHRDIKPANILLTEKGDVRLIDFGIVKQQDNNMGTSSIAHAPAWAAPEQILPEYQRENGHDIFRLSTKTDIYGLGLVSYYLCTNGSEPKNQADLHRRKFSLYAEHIAALKKGIHTHNIGGLGESDKQYLQTQLLHLFFLQANDKISLFKKIEQLPSPEWISHQLAHLIEKLLSPNVKQRPTAKEARQCFIQLRQSLSPTLYDLRIKKLHPKTLQIGQQQEIEICLQGQGLIKPLSWLKIYSNDHLLLDTEIISILPSNRIFLAKHPIIQLRLPPTETSGAYHIRVVANVKNSRREAELSYFVDSSHREKAADTQYINTLIKQSQKQSKRLKFTDVSRLIFTFIVLITLLVSILSISILSEKSVQVMTVSNTFTQVSQDFSFEPKMRQVPSGNFQMGCLDTVNSRCDANEQPQHLVSIKSFWISQYEVTKAQWDACAKAGVCPQQVNLQAKETLQHPAINISWNDTQLYIQWLNNKTHKHYRLPSEAEWEYAARAGSNSLWSFGSKREQLTDFAWFSNNSQGHSYPVGTKEPNLWGLYDVHGNVWEWVQDCNYANYKTAPNKGSAWQTEQCSHRIYRGGSWNESAYSTRSANRFYGLAHQSSSAIGFRLVRDHIK